MKPWNQIPIIDSFEKLISIDKYFKIINPHPYYKLGAPYKDKNIIIKNALNYNSNNKYTHDFLN